MSDRLVCRVTSGPAWTATEEAVVRAAFASMPAGWLARRFGRSVHAVRILAWQLCMTTPAPLPPVVSAVELMADLANARLECDALRVLLALKFGMLSEEEAAAALGLSHETPPPTGTGGPGRRRTSPLTMHALEQAARGMDIASTRLGSGGVLGVGEGGRFAPGGGRR